MLIYLCLTINFSSSTLHASSCDFETREGRDRQENGIHTKRRERQLRVLGKEIYEPHQQWSLRQTSFMTCSLMTIPLALLRLEVRMKERRRKRAEKEVIGHLSGESSSTHDSPKLMTVQSAENDTLKENMCSKEQTTRETPEKECATRMNHGFLLLTWVMRVKMRILMQTWAGQEEVMSNKDNKRKPSLECCLDEIHCISKERSSF